MQPIWLLWTVAIALCLTSLLHDFRRGPLVGDQASYLLQALSLAHDFDLKFTDEDLARWSAMGWAPRPNGLLFKTFSGGPAFAKPYLYSAFLAPFVGLLGSRWGVGLADATIFAWLVFVSLKIARRWFDEATAALVVAAVLFASNVYFYVFVIHPDLFHTALTATFCLLALSDAVNASARRIFIIAGLLGVCASEKTSLLILLAPIFIWLLGRTASWRTRSLAILVCALTFAISAWPYLHYSDYGSWNPYFGSTRFYSESGTTTPETSRLVNRGVSDLHQAGFKGFRAPDFEIVRSAWFYLFGAYTGLLIFAPATLLLVSAASFIPGHRDRAIPWLTGIGLMALGYIVFDPANYYGGSQAIGNRWFLKAIPVGLALTVAARVPPPLARRLAAAGMILSGLFLYRHHLSPIDAFANCTRANGLRRCFPFELNQKKLVVDVIRTGDLVNISWLPRIPRWQIQPPPLDSILPSEVSLFDAPPADRIIGGQRYVRKSQEAL